MTRNAERLVRSFAYHPVMVDRAASRWRVGADDGNCAWFELDRGAG